eukprot:2278243-Rhodomonas_salina.3
MQYGNTHHTVQAYARKQYWLSDQGAYEIRAIEEALENLRLQSHHTSPSVPGLGVVSYNHTHPFVPVLVV